MKVLLLALLFSASVAAAPKNTTAKIPVQDRPEFQETLNLQILLDRAHFSTGEIDGVPSVKITRALKAFQEQNNLEITGVPDAGTTQALNATAENMLIDYTLTAADLDVKLVKSIPRTMLAKSKLQRLRYTSLSEALSERFQVSPNVFKFLNPTATFSVGSTVKIPAVGGPLAAQVSSIVVSKANSSLTLRDAQNKIVGYYPVTLGAQVSPSPSGTLKVKSITKNPYYNYDPERFESKGTTIKVTLPPGPNNPVGLVWIALSKRHYGIHGTPDPSKISKTNSHGCIRLVNWDALEVADAVAAGVPVLIE